MKLSKMGFILKGPLSVKIEEFVIEFTNKTKQFDRFEPCL